MQQMKNMKLVKHMTLVKNCETARHRGRVDLFTQNTSALSKPSSHAATARTNTLMKQA